MTCPSNLFLFSNHISRKKFASSTADRSEEHTSELQSLVISYAVFCLKKNRAAERMMEPEQVKSCGDGVGRNEMQQRACINAPVLAGVTARAHALPAQSCPKATIRTWMH